jgi:hypothetical protein
VAPPKNARWHSYLRRPLRGTGHHGQAAGVLTDVPVEAALHIARPHEVVDPSIENDVESIFPVRPVAQEMADVRPTALARGGHQHRSVMHLMEGLIPDLIDVTGLVPATAHAVRRAIEEEQARSPCCEAHPKNLHHVGADVVTNEAAATNVHGIQQRDDIVGERDRVDSVGRTGMRVLALSESSKVGSYQPITAGEAREDRLPRCPELGPAM